MTLDLLRSDNPCLTAPRTTSLGEVVELIRTGVDRGTVAAIEWLESLPEPRLDALCEQAERALRHWAELSAQDDLQGFVEWVRDELSLPEAAPVIFRFFPSFRHLWSSMSPEYRNRMLARYVGQLRGTQVRRAAMGDGKQFPENVILSVTTRCNQKCPECYAGGYEKTDMALDVADRAVREASEGGCKRVYLTGGEPFLWPHLRALVERHPDTQFIVYTNGTRIGDAEIDWMLACGNLLVSISAEGSPKTTDDRRGTDHFRRLCAVADNMRAKKLPYMISVTVTTENLTEVTSKRFSAFWRHKGAVGAWYFMYFPSGHGPNLSPLLRPEQRLYLRHRVDLGRSYLFAIGAWQNAAYVDGCMAGGRGLVHVNVNGQVEPCIFCHFQTDSLENRSFVDCLKSAFFADLIKVSRQAGPAYDRPCPMMDWNRDFAAVIAKHEATPTHEGAGKLIEEYSDELQARTQRFAKAVALERRPTLVEQEIQRLTYLFEGRKVSPELVDEVLDHYRSLFELLRETRVLKVVSEKQTDTRATVSVEMPLATWKYLQKERIV